MSIVQSVAESAFPKRLSLSMILTLSIALLASGCGGGGNAGGGSISSGPTITSVTVSCTPASIQSSQTSSCAATVQGTGAYSSAVTWQATDGSITNSGVFTASSSGTAKITATSVQDNTKSGTVTVVVGTSSQVGEWAWMSGSNTIDGKGVYGTEGTASSTNVPGARNSASSWMDSSGNLWLFGGEGFDSTGTTGGLNDLWKFNPSDGTWTWMGGNNTVPAPNGGQSGVYGTLGTPSVSNIPGGRYGAVSWTDGNGNFWLFGGTVPEPTAHGSVSNDLWRYQP